MYNQDLHDIHAVVATTVDFSKAYNRQNHHKILVMLYNLNVPGWLLNIVKGFLENRELQVKFHGVCSDRMRMPGGSPQGTILAVFLFLVEEVLSKVVLVNS